MEVDIEKQKALIEMLRDGYVVSEDEIRGLYGLPNPHEFVAEIIERTGLDIKVGKRLLVSPDSGEHFDIAVFFLATDVRQESAGLDEMFEATEEPLTDTEEEIEYRDGHYIMWVCPTVTGTMVEGYVHCSQFHKVDLGDEELTSPKTVQCVQCGQKYQIKPKE